MTRPHRDTRLGPALVCMAFCLSHSSASASRAVQLGSPPQGELQGIQFLSSSDGWAYGLQGLWKTHDAGVTWSAMPLPPSKQLPLAGVSRVSLPPVLRGASFQSPEIGWVKVEQWNGKDLVQTVYWTHDGAKTWDQLPPLPLPNGVVFFEGSDGVAGWQGGARLSTPPPRLPTAPGCISPADKSRLNPVVFHTSDAGHSWVQQSLPQTWGCPIRTLFFRTAQEGFAGAGHRLYYTLDGGADWRLSEFRSNCVGTEWVGNDWSEPVFMFFLNERIGWLGSLDGFLFSTTDGGRSWCQLRGPGGIASSRSGLGDFGSLYFDTPLHGLILEGDGKIYETRDAGSSWYPIVTTDFISSFSCADGEHCWALSGKKLYRIESGEP